MCPTASRSQPWTWAAVLPELNSDPSLHESAEDAASLELRKLVMVADQHELSAGCLDVMQEQRQLSR
jgi:hypothetical protein